MDQPGQTAALLPARRVIGTGLELLLSRPREVVLPVAVVEIPVAVITAVVSAIVLLTVMGDTPLDPGERAYTALLLIVAAVQALYAQVAHAAAIVSTAAVLRGERKPLTQALDPAFSRMGGLLALLLILVGISVVMVVSLIGLVLLPYIAVRLALAYQALILEGRSPLGAIARSWGMMQGHMLRMLGVLLLTMLILLGPVILLTALESLVQGSRTMQVLAGAGVSVAQGVIAVPLVAFTSATTTVFYLNLEGANRG